MLNVIAIQVFEQIQESLPANGGLVFKVNKSIKNEKGLSKEQQVSLLDTSLLMAQQMENCQLVNTYLQAIQ